MKAEYIPTFDYAGIHTWFPVTKRPDPPSTKAPIICPRGTGKECTSPGGKVFKVSCETHTIGERTQMSKIKTVNKLQTLEQCMDACGETTDCKRQVNQTSGFSPMFESAHRLWIFLTAFSVDFIARNGDHVTGDCGLYKLGGSATSCRTSKCFCPSYDSLYEALTLQWLTIIESVDCAWLVVPPKPACGRTLPIFTCPQDHLKIYTSQ